MVERFNRTIKTRIWRHFSERGNVRWVNVIQDLVNAYNHSRQGSIKMAQANVQNNDENRRWVRLYCDGNTYLKASIIQGVMVRASSQKTIFDKGYMPNRTKEQFTVSQALPLKRGTKRRVYKLVDYNIHEVKGSRYPKQIQEITDNQYRIEKVLRRCTLPDNTKNYSSVRNVGQTSTICG